MTDEMTRLLVFDSNEWVVCIFNSDRYPKTFTSFSLLPFSSYLFSDSFARKS